MPEDEVDLNEMFPEHEAIQQGDPFLRRISEADDLITDHRYNFDWLGETEQAGAAIADQIEGEQLAYELVVLQRWWAL